MIRQSIILISFLVLISSGYSQINQEFPDECYVEYLDDDKFNSFLENNSFRDVTRLLVSDIIDSNYSMEKRYEITNPDLDIDLNVIFSNDISQDIKIFGSHSGNTVTIYINKIKNYSDEREYNFSQFIDLLENTLKHEITHYIDLNKGTFENKSSIFNAELNSLGSLENQQYYIDLYSQVNQSPIVSPVLQSTLDFEFVFNNYDTDYHLNEVVARINSICVNEINNSVFSYNWTNSFAYCDNFNFVNEDSDYFSVIAETIMKQYYFDEYPDERVIARSLDNEDLCHTQNIIGQSITLLNNITGSVVDLFINNILVFSLVMVLTGTAGLGTFIGGRYFKQQLSNLIDRKK